MVSEDSTYEKPVSLSSSDTVAVAPQAYLKGDGLPGEGLDENLHDEGLSVMRWFLEVGCSSGSERWSEW